MFFEDIRPNLTYWINLLSQNLFFEDNKLAWLGGMAGEDSGPGSSGEAKVVEGGKKTGNKLSDKKLSGEVGRKLRYPIGSSFTLRPNMLRDYKSGNTSPSLPIATSSDTAPCLPHATSTDTSPSLPPAMSRDASATLSKSLPPSTSSSCLSAVVTSPVTASTASTKSSFFAEIPSGYFSLRRPFTSSSLHSSRNSAIKTGSSWNSGCFSSFKQSSTSKNTTGTSKSTGNTAATPGTSSNPTAAPESKGNHRASSLTWQRSSCSNPGKEPDTSFFGVHGTSSPEHGTRPTDMTSLRAMKSMSVCEDSSYIGSPTGNNYSSNTGCPSYVKCSTVTRELSTGGGGVLGGVFAGIRDTMSSSANARYPGIVKSNISSSIGSLNCPSAVQGGRFESSSASGSNSNISGQSNQPIGNAHSISNSIGHCINNVTHASNRMQHNSSNSSDLSNISATVQSSRWPTASQVSSTNHRNTGIETSQ